MGNTVASYTAIKQNFAHQFSFRNGCVDALASFISYCKLASCHKKVRRVAACTAQGVAIKFKKASYTTAFVNRKSYGKYTNNTIHICIIDSYLLCPSNYHGINTHSWLCLGLLQ